MPHDSLLHLSVGIDLCSRNKRYPIPCLPHIQMKFIQSFILLELLVMFLYQSLQLLRIKHDSILILIRIGYIDNPDTVLMILLYHFTSFFYYLAFAELMVIGCHIFQINSQDPAGQSSYLEFQETLVSFEIDLYILDEVQLDLISLIINKGIIIQNTLVRDISVMSVFQMRDELFGLVFCGIALFAENALEQKGIKEMLISDVDVFFDHPGNGFAVRASIVSVRYDFVVSMTKDALTTLALFGIVQGYAITDWTGNKLVLQEAILGDPFLIDGNQLGFVVILLVLLEFLNLLLHTIL